MTCELEEGNRLLEVEGKGLDGEKSLERKGPKRKSTVSWLQRGSVVNTSLSRVYETIHS